MDQCCRGKLVLRSQWADSLVGSSLVDQRQNLTLIGRVGLHCAGRCCRCATSFRSGGSYGGGGRLVSNPIYRDLSPNIAMASRAYSKTLTIGIFEFPIACKDSTAHGSSQIYRDFDGFTDRGGRQRLGGRSIHNVAAGEHQRISLTPVAGAFITHLPYFYERIPLLERGLVRDGHIAVKSGFLAACTTALSVR